LVRRASDFDGENRFGLEQLLNFCELGVFGIGAMAFSSERFRHVSESQLDARRIGLREKLGGSFDPAPGLGPFALLRPQLNDLTSAHRPSAE
jgi:hypothetical protein